MICVALAQGACDTEGVPVFGPEGQCDSSDAKPAEARLLTRSEYRRTVQDLLGTELNVTTSFPPEPVVAGFDNDASSHQANPLLVEKHAEAAAKLTQEVLARGISTLFDCTDASDTCADSFIKDFGRRTFRRPLTETESAAFRLLYARAEPTLGHEQALGAILEAWLQSPQFLYRVEAPLGSSDSADGSRAVPLGAYEMASRLSYFLWGTTPDEELLEAAESGLLGESAGVEEQARRLLESEKARERVREFHEQWLGLSRLDSIARNDSPEDAAASYRESTHRFLDKIFWSRSSSVENLYSSPRIYVNKSLAPLYGLTPPEGKWAGHDLPDERSGLLTQPGIMALFSHADQSSPIQRGVFVREHILCEPVAPPPPSVNNNPPDPDPNLTTRELFQVHTKSAACAKCHELIDPLGFGFEQYDQLGRYRTEENGLPIDASGEVVGVDEAALLGEFDGAQELSARLSQSETVLSCLGRKWFVFAMGRAHTLEDRCTIDAAVARSKSEGGSLRELLIALAGSDGFRTRPPMNEEETP